MIIYIYLIYSFEPYTWTDQNQKKNKLPAPTYIDYVMTWAQNLINDENVFPTKAGKLRLFFSKRKKK